MLNNQVSKAVRLAIAFGAASTAAFSASSFAAEEEGVEKVERIQVTGSRISRTDMETATPVTVYTSVEIEKTGVSTVAEFLRTNASTGGFNESATLSQAAGASGVGIRGFGPDYTLILLNGRRLPKNSAGGVFTDINQIPMAAVSRIDVLTDGASAIYGSDAVAGVINIITKTDMEGVEAKVKYGAAVEHMDGDELQFSVTAGATSGNTNILFAADYFERRPIQAVDREMGSAAFVPGKEGRDGRSSYGIPGWTYLGGELPDGAAGYAPWSDCPEQDIAAPGICKYDFASLYQLQPASDRQSIFTSINHEYSDKLSFDAQFRYTRAYTLSSNAPAPGQVDVSGSPYLEDFLLNDRFNGDQALTDATMDAIEAGDAYAIVARRYIDFPNRQKDNTNETFEAIGGANYLLSDNWELDFDIGFSRLTNRQIGRAGQLLVDGVESAFADGSLNPFVVNDCSSAELAETCNSLNSAIHRTSEYELAFSSLAISGLTGLELPGGELGIAAGIDVRRENYLDRSDQASINGDVIGGAGSNGGGVFQNEAVFVELNLPILDNLEASLAVRNDSADWGESDASETTYSAKVSYRPTDDIMLRASYGTGFKAPALDSLYLSSSFGVQKAIDTKLCREAGNNPDHPDCLEQELNSKSGGNVELEPETSESYNLGLVYDVTENLSFTLDYWSLTIENIVGSLGIQEILDEEAKGNLTDLVVRNSSGRLTDTARTGYVKTDLQNLNEASASGLNYDIQYETDLGFGSLSTRLTVEQYLSFETQNSATQPLCDSIEDDSTRKYNANGNLTLETGDFTTSVNMRFLPGYDDYDKRDTGAKSCNLVGYYDTEQDSDGNYTDYGRSQHVASYVQFDLTGAYHLNENNTFTIGVRNLFDRQPPFSAVNDWPFYSQSTYDNIGRFAYIQYDVKF